MVSSVSGILGRMRTLLRISAVHRSGTFFRIIKEARPKLGGSSLFHGRALRIVSAVSAVSAILGRRALRIVSAILGRGTLLMVSAVSAVGAILGRRALFAGVRVRVISLVVSALPHSSALSKTCSVFFRSEGSREPVLLKLVIHG